MNHYEVNKMLPIDVLAFYLLLEIWKQCFEHLKNVYRDMLHCHPFRRCSSTGSSSLRRPSIPNSSARACVSYLVRCFQFHQAWDSRWIIMQIYAWLREGVSNNPRTSGLWSRFRNVLKEGRKKIGRRAVVLVDERAGRKILRRFTVYRLQGRRGATAAYYISERLSDNKRFQRKTLYI